MEGGFHHPDGHLQGLDLGRCGRYVDIERYRASGYPSYNCDTDHEQQLRSQLEFSGDPTVRDTCSPAGKIDLSICTDAALTGMAINLLLLYPGLTPSGRPQDSCGTTFRAVSTHRGTVIKHILWGGAWWGRPFRARAELIIWGGSM